MRSLILATMALATCAVVQAQAHTKAQAEKIVRVAVDFANQNGMDKLIAQTNQADGRFHVGSGSDLYLFIYDQQGVCRGIGFNPQGTVGMNRMALKDPDGKPYIHDFIELAKTKGSGWLDYKRLDPRTNKVEDKTSFVMMCKDMVIGCGVYKP